MEYEHLPVAEQRAMIEQRLASAERDHLSATLDREAAGANALPQSDELIEAAAARIEKLRGMLGALNG